MSLPKTIVETQKFLAWNYPGEKEMGRVELIPATNFRHPQSEFLRTSETIEIPAGCILTMIAKEPDIDVIP